MERQQPGGPQRGRLHVVEPAQMEERLDRMEERLRRLEQRLARLEDLLVETLPRAE